MDRNKLGDSHVEPFKIPKAIRFKKNDLGQRSEDVVTANPETAWLLQGFDAVENNYLLLQES